jgi:hypothetical protein
MENAGTSVAAGAPEQPDQAYQFDLDPTAELDDDGLKNFAAFEGPFEDLEHIMEEEMGMGHDAELLEYSSKLLDEGHENYNPPASDEQAQTAEVAEDIGDDAEVEPDHQDEIGYEDDDFAATDFNVDFGAVEGGESEAGVPQAPSGGDLQPVQRADNGSPEASTHPSDASEDKEIDEEQEESIKPPDDLSNVAEEQAAGEEAGERREGNDLIVEDFDDWASHEQPAANQQDSELYDALEDLSHSLPPAPQIEVLYEEGSYSLIGKPDDDPDSYFLSEAKELDRPLSQLLSALRSVISDDIAATDELVIRFDPLDLEFGERSSAKFLSRSFREILGCHATLCQVPGISADPVIRLTVRRDVEEQFLELLTEAELVRGVPHDAEDSEMSEGPDESAVNALDDDHVEDEAFTGGNLGEYHGEGDEHGAAERVEGENELELETGPGQDDAEVGEEPSQAGDSAPQASNFTVDAVNSEEQPDDIEAEAHYQSPEDGAGEGEAWDEQEAEHSAEPEHHAKTPVEVSDEQTKGSTDHQESDEFLGAEISIEALDEQKDRPTEQQESDESLEWTNSRAWERSDEQAHEAPEQESGEPFEITVEGAAAPENGGPGQETDANGKYPSPLPPAPISKTREWPAALSPLHRSEYASVLIGEGVPGLVYAPRAGGKQSKTSQPSTAQGRGSTTALEQEEFWEIDYSDDEDEPIPSDRLEDGALSRSEPRPSGPISLGSETEPGGISAGLVDSFGTNKTESSGVSMAFSFGIGANQGADQDDDLILAFDDEPALSTIHDEADEHEEYATTYEASDFIADEAEGMPSPNAAETANEPLSEKSENGVPARTATETSSIHTSTTINGDEIEYEENAANGSYPPADDVAQQPAAAASGIDNDEIDWENDEDEYEEQPADENAGPESEESKEAALTPPSIAGKRSRTDETESLADETGMLAHPSPKRMRMS